MLLFTAVGCGPCEALMPEIGRWQREYATALTIAVLSSGPVEAVATIARDHGLTYVLRQDGYEVAQQYRYVGTPGAVVVSIDGTISTPVVGGADAIRALLSQVVGKPQPAPLYRRSVPAEQQESHHHGPPPSTGDPAPKLRLSDSKGAVVDLADFEGREVVLLFWNPACRFCEQMLPDLRAWDERPPVGAPMLAVVSIGSSASSASIGLRSPVLLDPESSAMHAFGANGTPMAIRLAADGTIASSLAVGKQEVFRLLGLDDGASLLEESQG
jgi:peroxiredoxin